MIQHKLQALYEKLGDSDVLRCIRGSLVMLIPIILIGSFATVLEYLPLPAYQELITSFQNGILITILEYIYGATSGMASVYMTISLAMSYSQQKNIYDSKNSFGLIFTSVACFALWSGVSNIGEFHIETFGTTGMFTAIICGLGSAVLYTKISRKIERRHRSFADGADETFQTMLSSWLPMLSVLGIFLVFYVLMIEFLHFTSFTEMFSAVTHAIFKKLGRSLGTSVLYEVVLNLMWFFGIHGGNVLEYATQNLFDFAVGANSQIISENIYNSAFLNVFVAMGGCGTIWSLILAVVIFSKRRNNRRLATIAMVPGVFNISEIIIFGLPVVFNPIFFLPFILTPVVLVLTSAFAINVGLVPPPTYLVSWTTPVILGGYMATGSVSGAILQLVNLGIGILIYAPFVKLYDSMCMRDSERKLNGLVDALKQSEAENKQVALLALPGDSGMMAKMLSEDLQYNMAHDGLPTMYYQPQYNKEGECIGVEALLRWIYPAYGLLYPPLVIKLAEEAGLLSELEKDVFKSVIRDMEGLLEILPKDAKISLNVTGETIQLDAFSEFLSQMQKKYPEYCRCIVLEITEQAALKLDSEVIERLTKIRDMGYQLAIDDFSMGSTSIKYLQANIFSVIKLDGAISRSVLHNERSCDIIASITKLAKDMDINVIAEYVENEKQREILEKIGCYWYQGYLYGAALPLDRLKEQLLINAAKKERLPL